MNIKFVSITGVCFQRVGERVRSKAHELGIKQNPATKDWELFASTTVCCISVSGRHSHFITERIL